MEVLKALVILILVIEAFADEPSKRQGKCGSKPMNRGRFSNVKRKHQRKPMPLHNHAGHKYNIRGDSSPQSSPYISSADASSETQTPYETQQTPHNEYPPVPDVVDEEAYAAYLSSFDISPRISISPTGEIRRGRYLKYQGAHEFHNDDSKDHSHDQNVLNNEDHDQHHKTRTVRSTSKGPSSSPLNVIGTENSANAGDFFQSAVFGVLVDVQNHGTSSSSGKGVVNSIGNTTITQGALGAQLPSLSSSQAAV